MMLARGIYEAKRWAWYGLIVYSITAIITLICRLFILLINLLGGININSLNLVVFLIDLVLFIVVFRIASKEDTKAYYKIAINNKKELFTKLIVISIVITISIFILEAIRIA